jgi:adenine specific DNA methylase Mod
MRTTILWVRDNLDLLKDLYASNQRDLDLIYIDLPFNSKRNYNMAFTESDATEQAFTDIWSNYGYKEELREIGEINPNLYIFLNNLEKCLPGSYVSYLTAMGIRCWYMRELLKDTGSFYFHCDDTIGHYMKTVLDYIFGINNFRNHITWQRSVSSKSAVDNYPRNTDIILYYTKSDDYTFNQQYKELSEGGLKPYRLVDQFGRKYRLNSALYAEGVTKEWIIDGKVIKHPKGKGFAWTQETLDRKRKEHFEKYGTELIQISKNGVPSQVRYFEDSKGALIDNNWTDINCLQGSSKERLGYPTQKPEALLERIILTSSNAGDKVADFYLGGGTTAAAAIKNGREFLGCDINLRAVQITKDRLEKLGCQFGVDLFIKGVPFTSRDLKDYLAYIKEINEKKNVEKFELEEITCKYYLKNVVGNTKKVGDGGFDGVFGFKYNGENKKGGVQITSSSNLNHFKGFAYNVEKGLCDIGVYVCFEESVTSTMRKMAKDCGKIGNVDRLQILTFEDMLDKKLMYQTPADSIFS